MEKTVQHIKPFHSVALDPLRPRGDTVPLRPLKAARPPQTLWRYSTSTPPESSDL